MKNFLISVVLFLFVQKSFSQSLTTDYTDALHLIDSWIEAQRDYLDIPSISVAIVKDQETIWTRAYGMSNSEGKVAASTNTLYSICSISKLFTSVAIMQLYDAGKLRLDDSIEAILPHYNLKQQYKGSGPVTIRSLLTHSSGLPRESDFPYWTGPDFPFPTQAQLNAKLGEQQTLYPSSTWFQYSNLGMTLLGEVVEKISGQPYDKYIEENILKPLRLNSTHTYIPKEEWGKKMAVGYGATKREGPRDKINLFDAKGIKAAAGFSSNVEDLARFASWQFRLLNSGVTEILKSSTLKEMHRVQWVDPDWKTFWGLGFAISQQEGTTIVGHGGSCPGYRTTLQLDPKEKLAYTVMINAGGESPEVFAKEIREIISKVPKAAKKSAVNLEQYTGTYTSQPWGSEIIVTPWYGDLAVLNLPNVNPDEAMVLLQHVSGDIFKRIRKDKTLAEEVRFEKDSTGKVTRMLQHSNYSTRIISDKK
ncbi:MAG TPA: serine hydrolase [Chitinophagaceae bacterium]|nr:serine hydrolase [Chitinophagaceae bacterium]